MESRNAWRSTIVRAVTSAARGIGRALNAYYPLKSAHARQPEAFLTNHLARALPKEALIYPERTVDIDWDGRLDMVILFPADRVLVGVECKNLSRTRRDFRTFAEDLKKLQSFGVNLNRDMRRIRVSRIGCVLLASTWFSDVVESWESRGCVGGLANKARAARSRFFMRMREHGYVPEKEIPVGVYEKPVFRPGSRASLEARQDDSQLSLLLAMTQRTPV